MGRHNSITESDDRLPGLEKKKKVKAMKMKRERDERLESDQEHGTREYTLKKKQKTKKVNKEKKGNEIEVTEISTEEVIGDKKNEDETTLSGSKTSVENEANEAVPQPTCSATSTESNKETIKMEVSTVDAPKIQPRFMVASGLVPRQIARQSKIKAKITTSSSSHVKVNTKSVAPDVSASSSATISTTSSASMSTTRATTNTVTTTSTTATGSRSIFRAKDIISNKISSLPSSESSYPHGSGSRGEFRPHPHQHGGQQFHNSNRPQPLHFSWYPHSHQRQNTYSTDTQSASTTSAITTPASTETTSVTTAIIRASPLFVHPEHHPQRYEYPYGNYPSYYEKRLQEQTKRIDSVSGKSLGSTNTKQHQPPSQGQGQGRNRGDQDQQQRQKQHYRFTATPSVLFPSSSNGSLGGGGTRISLKELGKKVDLRLEFLEQEWFRDKRVLDIGCNSALLTVFIALHFKPRRIQGVDIDPSLIGKAQNFVLKTFSQIPFWAYTQQQPQPHEREDGGSFKNNDKNNEAMDEQGRDKQEDVPYEAYFPRALQRMHGTLPVPKKTVRTECLFPHNIEFRITDWVAETENQEESGNEQWDVVLGFSLTKWIHLHHGDEGIKRFFQKVYRSLAPGGIFLVEPQDFATYKKRSKITPAMDTTYKSIQFKPEHFQDYLVKEVGFREVVHLGHSEGSAKNFNRDIFLYRK
ncbi:hypothetical protein BGZ51_002097 [Haplosporangium sp. Z 767]|nr:hypothetical protein BGZ50_002885 [Haplosporangium sp. Z 11]KAF9186296.1 hypothetical protein BGZ51_002097 [Haplosporangium sp. Z 767]